jgi:hypothetical protein
MWPWVSPRGTANVASSQRRLGKVRKDSGDALDGPMASKVDKLLARADAALQQAATLHETADVN